MLDSLTYNVPKNEYSAVYGDSSLLAENTPPITTQLPENIAVIRIVAALALPLIVGISLGAIFFYPAFIAGAGFAGWTAYTHLFSKDPLLELFYQIVGGEDKFNQLPEIDLQQDPHKKLFVAIQKLQWDEISHAISRAKTLDGRHVVVIKGFSYGLDGVFSAHTKNLFAFIEKVGPADLPRVISNEPESVTAFLHAVFLPLEGNTFDRFLFSCNSSNSEGDNEISVDSYEINICASITAFRANEFFAQLNPVIA